MCNNTTANSAQEKTSFTCNDNDNDDSLRGVVNYETEFAGRKGKAILNEGETDAVSDEGEYCDEMRRVL
jgi:hypothetical protein